MKDNPKNQQNSDSKSTGQASGEPAAVSSESLFDSEMSVGQGAIAGENELQENKEADPEDLK